MQEIRVKAIDKKLDPLRFTGDWVDVRISSVMYLDAVRSPEQFKEHAITAQLEYSRKSLQTTQVISIPAGHSIKVTKLSFILAQVFSKRRDLYSFQVV